MSRPIVSAPESKLAQLVDEAASLQRQGRLDEAERLFQAVLGEDAGNFEALQRIGAIRARRRFRMPIQTRLAPRHNAG